MALILFVSILGALEQQLSAAAAVTIAVHEARGFPNGFGLPAQMLPTLAKTYSLIFTSHTTTAAVDAVQVEPQRAIANIRLPCAGLPAICCLQHPAASAGAGGGSTAGSGFDVSGGGGASSGLSEAAALPDEANEVGHHEICRECCVWECRS